MLLVVGIASSLSLYRGDTPESLRERVWVFARERERERERVGVGVLISE